MLSDVDLLRQRLERLQRIATELSSAVTIEDVVQVVLTVLDTPTKSPSRGLWVHASDDKALDLVASSGMPEEAVAQFARIPLDADLPGAIAHREVRTVLGSSRAESEAEFPELRDTPRSTEGFVAVPLVLEGVSLGVLGMGYDVPPSPEDIAFLEAVARQVAQTLARVRLSDRDRRRREELEFLADLTDVALLAESHQELMANVTAAAVPMLGDWCTLYFLPEGGAAPEVTVAHVDPAKAAWIRDLQQRYYGQDRDIGVAAVMRTGKTEYIPAVTRELIDEAIERARIDPDEARPVLEAFALRSVITVPLLTKRRVVGAMQVMTSLSGRRYDDDDVALTEAVAGRLAEALETAWQSDHHRYIASTLQRALLPPRLADVPGVDTAARYWPAGVAEVGGDFYDLFALDDDEWCVVIGDACGTGPNAAALTSIARHTVRAAARHGMEHHQVMEWLNEAIARSDRDLFCTACYGTLTRDGDNWQLRTVASGHPLPIVVSPTRGVTTLGRPGSLLGVYETVNTTVADVLLEPGDAVIFYTDGVTDLPPPAGLSADQLVALLEKAPGLDSAAAIAEAIRESVLERIPDPQRQDDIAVLVLRVEDGPTP